MFVYFISYNTFIKAAISNFKRIQTGKVVTGYRIRGNETKMVGKADPIGMPENFFPREGGTIDLRYGDKLIARCDYVSDRDVDTVWG